MREEKSLRSGRWVHLLAVLLGVVPIYAFGIWFHLTGEEGIGLREFLSYPLIFGGGSILLILILMRFMCGESVKALDTKHQRWHVDVAQGVLLLFLFALLALVEQFTVARWFPRRASGAFAELIMGLLENPLLLFLWLGPVVWIGVAGFEELSRVFAISRLWKVWPGRAGRWSALFLSAAIFGLVHLYQGTAGIISSGLLGLVAGLFYMRFGRVWPLVISHALYDSGWIIFGLVLFSRSTA